MDAYPGPGWKGGEGNSGWLVATMARLLCPGSIAPPLPHPVGFSHETLMQLPANLEETGRGYTACIRNSFTACSYTICWKFCLHVHIRTSWKRSFIFTYLLSNIIQFSKSFLENCTGRKGKTICRDSKKKDLIAEEKFAKRKQLKIQ